MSGWPGMNRKPIAVTDIVDGIGMLPIYGRDGIVCYASIDPADVPRASVKRWHLDRDGAVWCHDHQHRTTIKLHRFITGAPRGMDVDHINHDRLDNRSVNLRVCTHAQNMMNNEGLKGTMRGVRKIKNRWAARITSNRVDIHLGCFGTPGEAVAARRAAEIRIRGSFAPAVVSP